MNLDIKTAVQVAFFLSIFGIILGVWLGIRNINEGRKLLYFRKRHDLITKGWRLIFVSILLLGLAFFFNRYAEPAIYLVFPPSPTITLTPTLTLTPTITLTPTVTFTASITPTPAISYTPEIPTQVYAEFTSVVNVNENAVFSVPQIARKIDEDYQPIDPLLEFENPIEALYATYSYDQMTVDSQWSAIWFRLSDREIICYETKPWDGSTGGYGYTECRPSSDAWKPGEYEVQIFVGTTWTSSQRFSVIGEPPTPTITRTPTWTQTVTRSPTASNTITLTPSVTPTLTLTPTPTITLTPSLTPTRTETPTKTLSPTVTRTPTKTQTPTLTTTFTKTVTPTQTFTPSLTPTPYPTSTIPY